ncbi:hypothetical protein [uncultured Thiohalocapsa sp.]|uniref:hypothetical protein n=1 Tax=uncultured Thiohalocapsa sp. TaxID=768990 RepID=UPI0025DFF8ED|nr:hypothetical protein [uncultured Thiohalocapsa sp.]
MPLFAAAGRTIAAAQPHQDWENRHALCCPCPLRISLNAPSRPAQARLAGAACVGCRPRHHRPGHRCSHRAGGRRHGRQGRRRLDPRRYHRRQRRARQLRARGDTFLLEYDLYTYSESNLAGTGCTDAGDGGDPGNQGDEPVERPTGPGCGQGIAQSGDPFDIGSSVSSDVPAPGTAAVVLLGLAGLGVDRRRRRH